MQRESDLAYGLCARTPRPQFTVTKFAPEPPSRLRRRLSVLFATFLPASRLECQLPPQFCRDMRQSSAWLRRVVMARYLQLQREKAWLPCDERASYVGNEPGQARYAGRAIHSGALF